LPSTFTALHGNGAMGDSEYRRPCADAWLLQQSNSVAATNKIDRTPFAIRPLEACRAKCSTLFTEALPRSKSHRSNRTNPLPPYRSELHAHETLCLSISVCVTCHANYKFVINCADSDSGRGNCGSATFIGAAKKAKFLISLTGVGRGGLLHRIVDSRQKGAHLKSEK
jgi:hypothetical protein